MARWEEEGGSMKGADRPGALAGARRSNHLENQARSHSNPSSDTIQHLEIYSQGYRAGLSRAADILDLAPHDKELLREVYRQMFAGGKI